MAECSESTGTIWPGAAAALTSGPPTMSDSLLARASVAPGVERGERRAQADRAGDAVEDDVGAASRPRSAAASGPATTSGRYAARPASAAYAPMACGDRSCACPRAHATTSTGERDRLAGHEVEVAAGATAP